VPGANEVDESDKEAEGDDGVVDDESQDDADAAEDDEDVVAAWLSALGNAEADDDSDERRRTSAGRKSTTPATTMKRMKIHQRHKIPTCNHYQKRMKKDTRRRTISTFSTSVMCERTSFHWSFS
jgi:hypothetical protein